MRTCEGSMGGRGVPVSTCEMAQPARASASSSRSSGRTIRIAGALVLRPPAPGRHGRGRRRDYAQPGLKPAWKPAGCRSGLEADPGTVDGIAQPALDVPGQRPEARLHAVTAALGQARLAPGHDALEAGQAFAVLVQGA